MNFVVFHELAALNDDLYLFKVLGYVVISHSGSDGTCTWAWPEQDLIVLYFNQSRGSASGIYLESDIDRLFSHPELEEINTLARDKYASYSGTYVANYGPFQNAEFTVVV